MDQEHWRGLLLPKNLSPESPTDKLIRLLGAVDLRGQLPTRAGAESYPRRLLSDVKWFVVHHTGDGPERPTARVVAEYQTSPGAGFPFPSIAYHLFIEDDGMVEVCHDLDEECWSNGVGSPYQDARGVGIYNDWTISICFSGQDPTPAQWTNIMIAHSCTCAATEKQLILTGHGLLPRGGTSCPGPIATARLHPPTL